MIGVVTGREIKRNRDGARNVMLLQVEIADADDIQAAELIPASGEDYNPPNGARVFLVEAGAAYKIAVACDDGVVPDTAEGEKRIYAISGGAATAMLRLLPDGTARLNEGAGTAVEFSRLKTAFDQLKADFDAHVHPAGLLLDSVAGPCTGTTAAILVGSTADIDNAESPTVELP